MRNPVLCDPGGIQTPNLLIRSQNKIFSYFFILTYYQVITGIKLINIFPFFHILANNVC